MTGIIRKWNNLLDNESSTFRRIPIANFGLQLKFHCFRQKFRSLISYNHFTRPQILLFLKIYFISNRIFFTRNKIRKVFQILSSWSSLFEFHYFYTTSQSKQRTTHFRLISHLILAQCSISVPPENVKKPKVFWRFQGDIQMEYWAKMG